LDLVGFAEISLLLLRESEKSLFSLISYVNNALICESSGRDTYFEDRAGGKKE